VKKIITSLWLLSIGTLLFSQSPTSISKQPKLSDLRKRFYQEYDQEKKNNPSIDTEGDEEEDGLLAKFKRWEWLMQTRVMPDGTLPEPGIAATERANYLVSHPASGARSISWSQIGINGGGAGRVNVIRIDPSNTNTIYIGTASGGVWKTTDGGTSWTPITDNIADLSIADIAIDPANSNSIYIATGDGCGYIGAAGQNDFWGGLYSAGVFHSTDAGATWSATGLSYTQSNNIIVRRLLIDPSNSNNLLAVTTTGISSSTDAGDTWTQTIAATVNHNFYDLAYNTANSSIVYTGDNYNLYKSTDGGATWTEMRSGTYCASNNSIETSAANPQVIYSLSSSSSYGLLKSTDGGATWVTKTYPSGAGFNGYYNHVFTVSDANSDFLVVGGTNLAKSTDGGTTWTSMTGTGVDHHAIKFLPGSTSTFYDGADAGIYKTTNSGSSWTNITAGLSIAQVYRVASSATDPNIVYSGRQDNGSYRWDGNINTWTLVYGGDGMDNMVDYTNVQNVYVSVQHGSLKKSTDGGISFSSIAPCSGNWVTPIEIDPVTPSTIYQGCASIYKSTNSGVSWAIIGNALFPTAYNGCEDIAIAPSNVNVIYATSFITIMKTTNGGTTWTTITGTLPVTNTGINQIAISNTDPNKVWICLGGYSSGNKVFKSTDGGTTWTNISGTLPNIPVNTIVYENNSPDRVYVGTDVGVYYIDDNSSDWTFYNDGLPNVMVHELEINYSSNKLIAATYGRGLWQSDLVGSTNQSVISLSGNMNFGNIPVGSSSQQSLTVTNTGNVSLNVSSINYPSGFSGSWNSGSIAAGGNHNVTVTFSPLAMQTYSGTITVNSDASSGANTIACSGSGSSALSITTGAVTQNPICPNGALSVTYTKTGTFNSGNIFTAQLSNASGSFSSPSSIGAYSSTSSGSISCTISTDASGTGYRIRVVSSNPVVTGTNNGSNLSITCQVPASISTSGIAATSATVSWTGSACAASYEVDYKKFSGNNTWIAKTNITSASTILTGLNNATKYKWRVKTVCVSNPDNSSGFSSTLNFKTLSGKLEELPEPEVAIYPNPSNGNFELSISAYAEAITVYDLLGQKIWRRNDIEANSTVEIHLNKEAGIYFVEVRTDHYSIIRQIIID